MKFFSSFSYLFLAVAIALTCNSLSVIWAKDQNKFSVYLLLLLIISPLVFISFGLVTEKIGLALTSGIIDSSLTISSITIGLIFFHEWNKISAYQYLGIILSLCGIILMIYFPKN